jgi:hypothetical protein
MDILAHGLWAAAASKGAGRKLPSRIRTGWAVWWGVFPDLFAFTIPMAVRTWQWWSDPSRLPAPGARHGMPRMSLAWDLYQFSHSLFVFAAVFGLVWLAVRRPFLEMLAWPLHILMDIPSHTTRFFATPFLFPFSDFRVNGFSWGSRWFMITNYSALAAVFVLLWWTGRRARKRRAARRREEPVPASPPAAGP